MMQCSLVWPDSGDSQLSTIPVDSQDFIYDIEGPSFPDCAGEPQAESN